MYKYRHHSCQITVPVQRRCYGQEFIKQEKITLFKKNDQRTEKEYDKDRSLERRVVWIGNIDIKKAQERQIGSF